ncbi:MAG: hypothetical protein U0793_01415 [Gemmataceae bacterium]
MNKQRAVFIFALALAFVALGCGSSVKLTSVHGKIIQGGKAFNKGGTVVFHPDKKKGNDTPQPPTAELTESGEFTLKTQDREGAPLGWYKVTIASHVPPGKDPYAIPKSYVDKMYATPETTPVFIEVKEGQGPDAYEIRIP